MTERSPAHRRGIRRPAGPLLCAAVAVALAIWAGCTVTKDNYEVLSFFFDGVPDPNAPIGAAGVPIRQSPTYSLHQPYAERKCVECHGRRFNVTAVGADICLTCHEGVTDALPRMHGPVAAGACLWCHAPHESPYAALLKGPERDVCGACHTPDMLSGSRIPEHGADSEVGCLECHSAHGGTVRYFLHAGARDGAPETDRLPPGAQAPPIDPTDEPRTPPPGEEPPS